MRSRYLLCLILAAVASAQPARDRHVIVISLDGFPQYALDDPNVPLPVLRKLMREGATAAGMTPVNPTVTWPNHTSMVTGVDASRHGVIYNGLSMRPGEGKPLRVEPWVDKNELVLAPTVYDAAHDAGLTSAEVDWVAVYHTPSIDWSFAEQPRAEGAVEREMIDAGLVTPAELASWSRKPITLKDEIWTRAAVHIIEKHRPNLLLMHLLTTDSVQHTYGAKSLAANTALILADRQVARILEAIDHAGIRDRTTVIVVSDHGFKAYQHLIRPNALLRQKGLLRDKDGQVDADVWVMAEGGTAMVYVTRESQRAAALQVVDEAFPSVPGIVKIIRPEEFEQYGYPKWIAGGRMADRVLVAASNYAFDGTNKGEVNEDLLTGVLRGNHGYVNSDPEMTAILVLWGAGVKPGARAPLQPNVNVAATMARLLGLKLPGSQGTAIAELLR